MRDKLPFICMIFFCATTATAENKVTLYRDGALIRQEAVATNGVIDVQLTAGLLENTLKVFPAANTTIVSVETGTVNRSDKSDKKLDELTEQRRRLEDRLQALESREAIFTAAAKAQSGKAPRKTKANPDPMQTIRQGTDFAIAQLEAVYTARRKTLQEIKKTDNRIAATRKGEQAGKGSLRITVTPARGKVTFTYGTAERGWEPQYNINLAGDGTARLQLSARITESWKGYQTAISAGSLYDIQSAETFLANAGVMPLATYLLPVTDERYSDGIFNRFSGAIKNNSPNYLPSGESGLFLKGAYIGKFRFESLSSGRSRVISVGK